MSNSHAALTRHRAAGQNSCSRPEQAAVPAVTQCGAPAIGGSPVQAQRPSGQPWTSSADHLEQVIVAECAAWLALLDAVPDYGDRRAASDLTPLQRDLAVQYQSAHARRKQVLG